MIKAHNKYGVYVIPEEISYTYTAQTIINGDVHEPTTIEFIQSVGGNVVHAGAGFGDFLPALKDCNRVFVFEPNPLMYKCTLQTIILNNLTNVSLYKQALGESNCKSSLKNIDESGLEMGPRSEIGEGIRIDMIKLDDFIVEKIDLIHLDLEGYEFEALKGTKELIKRDKPLIVLEIDAKAVDYNNFMRSINYEPYKQLIYNSNEQMVFVNTVYKPINNDRT
jgi:FkbM family methyltransferase